jgi:hypothetical protein
MLGFFIADKNNRFYKLMYPWEHMDPHIMLLVFMPALIFESAFNTDPYVFSYEKF